jgi:hypothetical protein
VDELQSLNAKIDQIREKNAANCRELMERIDTVFDFKYQAEKIKAKKESLLAQIDQTIIAESKCKPQAKDRLGYLKLRKNEAYNVEGFERFNKFTNFYYSNDFKLKTKIM